MASGVVAPSDWFTERQVREVGSSLSDPVSVTAHRNEAFQVFRRLPVELNPLYRQYAYYGGVDLRHLDPAGQGNKVRPPTPDERSILVVHDAAGSHVQVPDELRSAGVQLEVVPELLRGAHAEPFLRAGEPLAEKFIALNSALLNRGVYLEVPDDLSAPVRVKDVTVLSRPN
ncbi:MAG: hypothetical protein KGI89_11615, partial [Euryarchaeota archaeon]|nr:hypothetical protein [Euryarchaeota archaeon]